MKNIAKPNTANAIALESLAIHMGDPTLAGWLIFFAYFAVVYRCYFKHKTTQANNLDVYFWLLVGSFLLLLGVNKQLDFQTIFEVGMKDLAKSHGWYAQRKMLQSMFVVVLAISFLGILTALRGFLTKSWQKHKTVCLGLFLLCIFIVLRAASFNQLSFLETQPLLGFNAHGLLELIALSIIFYGTYTTKLVAADIIFCQLEDGDVTCPHCGIKAKAKAADGRKFKCKICRYCYETRLSD